MTEETIEDSGMAGMSSYQQDSAPDSISGANPLPFRRSKSIKSDEELTLYGPLDVAGSVKSGSSITFSGDFKIRDKVDAYGGISMEGSNHIEGRIKAYGNIQVTGYLLARDKIKGYGKLRIVGTLEGTELEIYGNLTINGRLKLVLYGSLTLIGGESSYSVSEIEEVAGAKLMREQEADWDW